MENQENDDIIDDSQWWDKYYETEYAWEMDTGIYDHPVI